MSLSRIILNVIHYLFTFHTVFNNWLWKLRKPWKTSYYKQSMSTIRHDAKDLSKVPIHVGIVIVENDISFSDLARIAVWCMAFGIPYISIYDRAGVCQRGKEELQSKIHEQQQQILGADKRKYNVNLQISKSSRRSDGGCNATTNVDIILLSAIDGRQSIVNTTKKLCLGIANNTYTAADINTNNIANLFLEQAGYPDPDVILKFGHTHCLMGYLPWQIRLTEILCIPSHLNIDYKSLHLALVSYGSSEQRFGK